MRCHAIFFNLSLIAEVVKDSNRFLSFTNDVNLWERYYFTIEQREGEEISHTPFKLARESNFEEQTFRLVFLNQNIAESFSRNILIDLTRQKIVPRRTIARFCVLVHSFQKKQPCADIF